MSADLRPATPGELVARAGELRRRAARMANALDVLVWCPMLSPGGGIRLLWSLLPALHRDDRIRSVRLAAPLGAIEPDTLALLRREGVVVIELPPHHRNGAACAELVEDHGRVLQLRGTTEWRTTTAEGLAAGCDVLYAPWPHQDPPPLVSVPIVCTYQDTTLLDYPEALEDPGGERERAIAAEWLRRSAAVVVSSRSTAANLTRLFGDAAPRDPRVIRHAIRPRVLVRDGGEEDAVPAGLPERYVLFAGNAAVHKNADLLLTAWSRFELRTDWPLVVSGYGTESLSGVPVASNWRAIQLAGLVVRLGLGPGSGLHALGYVPDGAMAPLIANAAALIVPSFTEGGGSFSAEEALAAGLPVLCADIPAMREHAAERSAEFTWFDPASVDSILGAARRLVEDYEALRASALAGRDDPRPTWDDVAAEYASAFADVARRRARL